MDGILSVQNLDLAIQSNDACVPVLKNINLHLDKGKVLALVGESGSGKSMTANAILQLLPHNISYARASVIKFQHTDLLEYAERDMRHIRGNKISMVFQEPMSALNPVMTIGQQITEILQQHHICHKKFFRAKTCEILEAVGLDNADYYDYYPHQLSGGMRQRVVIAIAIAADPDVIIADEPTTALDAIMQQKILALLVDLTKKKQVALLLITHDLSLIRQYADNVALIYYGEVIEQAAADIFIKRPLHPYAKQLFATNPSYDKRGIELSTIKGNVPRLGTHFQGCAFHPRCQYALKKCVTIKPVWQKVNDAKVCCHLPLAQLNKIPAAQSSTIAPVNSSEAAAVLLTVKALTKTFKQNISGKVREVRAVNNVSFSIKKGECFALVGGSGSGKSTVAKLIAGLENLNAGEIFFEKENLKHKSRKEKAFCLQLIFQDPYNSLNPKLTISNNLKEAFQFTKLPDTEMQQTLERLIEKVGLPIDALSKFPHEFSGGQRQRIAIARAIAIKPQLIICDEPTSALDISVQAQILNLLKSLQKTYQLTLLLITHNFSVVAYMADNVAVMKQGEIVEIGSAQQVLYHPTNAYTKQLIQIVADGESNQHDVILD